MIHIIIEYDNKRVDITLSKNEDVKVSTAGKFNDIKTTEDVPMLKATAILQNKPKKKPIKLTKKTKVCIICKKEFHPRSNCQLYCSEICKNEGVDPRDIKTESSISEEQLKKSQSKPYSEY